MGSLGTLFSICGIGHDDLGSDMQQFTNSSHVNFLAQKMSVFFVQCQVLFVAFDFAAKPSCAPSTFKSVDLNESSSALSGSSTDVLESRSPQICGTPQQTWALHISHPQIICTDTEEEKNTRVGQDHDSSFSFESDTDENIDRADAEEENKINFSKRTTHEAEETMRTFNISCWIEAQRKLKWRLAM